jgi:uncharacterized protein (DUF983 family)
MDGTTPTDGPGADRASGDLPPVPPFRVLVGRALALACPLCGGRPVIRRWFGMHERCPRCGLRFERVVGHWFGSLTLNTIVSFGALLVVVMGLFLLSWPEAPPSWSMALAVGVTLAVPAVFSPFSRTLWLAVDLRARPLEPGEAHRPLGAPTTDGG